MIDAAKRSDDDDAAGRPSIFVIGPEGSGSTLVSSCVALHPELQDRRFLAQPTRVGPLPQSNAILHLSLPTLRPMRWVEAGELPDDAKVVAVRRSPLHTVYSAYRRYFDHPQPAWRSYLRAVATEAGYLERLNPFCLFYEDLVHHPRKVMRALYSYLGVDSEFMPALAFTDRNDERWREDWRFAAFVARTFGIPLDKTKTLRKAQSVKLSFGCYGANIAIDDASGAGIADALRKWLPPNLDPASGSILDAQYRIERHGGDAAGPGRYRVLAGDEKRLEARTPEAVTAWLGAEIDRVISEASRDVLFVHAGVVGWHGQAILIPGRTMTGKSTLVEALVRLGATYYSDEYAALDDSGRVHPYARAPTHRDGLIRPELDRGGAGEPLPVCLIVSTAFRPDAQWIPDEIRGARVAAPIIDNTVAAREQTQRVLQLAAKLAGRAALLRGPRPDAADVAPRLLAHLDDVAAGRASADPAQAVTTMGTRAEAALTGPAPSNEEILPPRYVQIDGFLDAAMHDRMLAYALAHERDFVTSTVLAADGGSRVDEEFRRSGTIYDLGEFSEPFSAILRRLLPHVRRELGLPWFPVGRIESQMAVHRHGGLFGRHIDNGGPAVSDRVLTCVYYFFRKPRGFEGGSLRLYDSLIRDGHVWPGSAYLSLEPADNSAVFFPSGTFHEVCPVIQDPPRFENSRFAITTWFRIGQQPAFLEVGGEQESPQVEPVT